MGVAVREAKFMLAVGVVCGEEVDECVAVGCMEGVRRAPVVIGVGDGVNMCVVDMFILNVGEVVRVRDGVI